MEGPTKRPDGSPRSRLTGALGDERPCRDDDDDVFVPISRGETAAVCALNPEGGDNRAIGR